MRAGTAVAFFSAFAAAHWLLACTNYESAYERGVYGYEPLYCYQSIGAVDCYREPHHPDAARLVNYYGPAPGKYDAPDAPKESPLRPPPKVKAQYPLEPAVVSAPATAMTRGDTAGRGSAAPGDGETGAGKAAEDKAEWKEWLPVMSVVFGALQLVAAFAF